MLDLLNYGISETTIKEMIEREPSINELSSDEINEKIYFLERLGLDKNEVINVISSNPEFFGRTNKDIGNILEKIVSLGFIRLDFILDANPYILNLDPFEIDNYINKRISNGETKEDIITDLEENPYLFSEV
jgi:hypothetical protein